MACLGPVDPVLRRIRNTLANTSVGADLSGTTSCHHAVDKTNTSAGTLVAEPQPVDSAGDGIHALVGVGRCRNVGVLLAAEQLAVAGATEVERRRVGGVEEVVAQELDGRAYSVDVQVSGGREGGGYDRAGGVRCHVQWHGCRAQDLGRQAVEVGRGQRRRRRAGVQAGDIPEHGQRAEGGCRRASSCARVVLDAVADENVLQRGAVGAGKLGTGYDIC